MEDIKGIIAAREAAKAAAEESAKRPEWEEGAEKALTNGKIERETVKSLAERIHAGGYPKNLMFCGVCVQIADEKDLASFWKTVYANLPKGELAKLSEEGHKPISEVQVRDALMNLYRKAGVAKELVENGIHEDIQEFESEGAYYVLAADMVIDMDGHVVCEVADIQKPYGPDEWVEVANRIKAAHAADEDDWEDYDDEEEDDAY